MFFMLEYEEGVYVPRENEMVIKNEVVIRNEIGLSEQFERT